METTMLTATGYVHSDMVVQYPGRPPARIQDAGQHGFAALVPPLPVFRGMDLPRRGAAERVGIVGQGGRAR